MLFLLFNVGGNFFDVIFCHACIVYLINIMAKGRNRIFFFYLEEYLLFVQVTWIHMKLRKIFKIPRIGIVYSLHLNFSRRGIYLPDVGRERECVKHVYLYSLFQYSYSQWIVELKILGGFDCGVQW